MSSRPVGAAPRRTRTPRRARPLTIIRLLALAVLASYPFALAALLLSPDGYSVNRLNVRVWSVLSTPAIREIASPELYATIWNVLLFIPAFAAMAVWIPRWWLIALGASSSIGVELYQRSLGSRDAALEDVLTNTLGAALGVALGIWIHRRVSRGPAGSALPAPSASPTPGGDPRPSAHAPSGGPDDRD